MIACGLMTLTTPRPESGASTGSTRAPRQAPNITLVTTILATLTAGVFAFWAGWTRRWISDDGLIVLRTVRNLLAGNGPVFNAGERVEANTSTLWQYLIYAWALVSDMRLEDIALWLAILFTTGAAMIGVLGTAHLHRNRMVILLPAGVIGYFSLSPARDFATSGLEWGLALFWIAVWWLLLVLWATSGPSSKGRRATDRFHAGAITYVLAFWAGLSWLIRPELALYGGLTGILLLVTAPSWRVMLGIIAVALPVPGGYQIFRMGYYGLIVPHTAVAKSATDSMWGTGWEYVLNFTGPYNLWLGLALLIAAGVVTVSRLQRTAFRRPTRLELRAPAVVVTLVFLCSFLHILYVVRVGGDFMHARMLLPPLFALLLPMAVIPISVVDRTWQDLVAGVLVVAVWIWSTVVYVNGHDWDEDGGGDVVDEREFWINFTNRDEDNPPMYAEDFLGVEFMENYVEVMQTQTLVEPTGQQLAIKTPEGGNAWITTPRMEGEEAGDLAYLPPTVFMVNLGMTSMNAPLDVRVTDLIGLATPLAARQPRIEGGRIGHDKLMALEWQVAESATPLANTPGWIDPEKTAQARQALRNPDLVELFEAYREPMSFQRFVGNIKYALTDGRTLEISDDPADLLKNFEETPPEFRQELPAIAWPVEIQLDEPRGEPLYASPKATERSR